MSADHTMELVYSGCSRGFQEYTWKFRGPGVLYGILKDHGTNESCKSAQFSSMSWCI